MLPLTFDSEYIFIFRSKSSEMKRVITIILCVLALGFNSMNVSAQLFCYATISSTDTINAAGVNTYTFTAVDSDVTAVFSWSFGDGSGGQGQVVSHTYNGGGNTFYVVTLTVADTALGCSFTTFDTIIPGGYLSPCAAYFNPTNIDTFYTLAVTVTGVPPFTYNWDLPDGTFSTLPDPTYVVGSTGTYSGFVVVTDSTGCIDTVNYVISGANSGGNTFCQAYFYVIPDSAVGEYTVVDYSSGSSLSYLWSFGDGDTSSIQYPTHNYTVPGYYTICLTVTSANGCTSSFCDSSFYAAKNSGGPMSGVNVISRSTALGIQPIANDASISIYPNPASSTLAVKVGTNDKLLGSTIYNTAGQKVAEFGSSALISIGTLTTGLYLIEVKTNNGIYRSTFVKQ